MTIEKLQPPFSTPLQSFLNELSQKTNPLVVFDLDSTLFNVTKRTEKILKDFSKLTEVRNKFPHLAQKISEIQIEHNDWGIYPALDRLSIQDENFKALLKKYWIQHFFSNHYLQYDHPYDGAVDFVNYIHDQTPAHILYLTGRDEIRMLDGTEKCLEQWGFPLENSSKTELVLKANPGHEDKIYKSEVLQEYSKKFSSIYFFENEPVIINEVEKNHTHIQFIFMKSVHSGKESLNSEHPYIEMSFLK